MILVHRLGGEPIYLNADLIESVEATPDTLVTLLDGRQLLVHEHPEAVVERFTTFRARLLAIAEGCRVSTNEPIGAPLTLVADPEV